MSMPISNRDPRSIGARAWPALAFVIMVSLAVVSPGHSELPPPEASTADAGGLVDSQSFLETALKGGAPPDPAIARRVRELVAKMTLREKVGQMTQLEIGMVTDGKG